MNEDVFVAPGSAVGEVKTMEPDIQEITEQIHKLLLQVREERGQKYAKDIFYGTMKVLSNSDEIKPRRRCS